MREEHVAAGLTCGSCGKWTEAGREYLAKSSRERPIYGTDFSLPLSVLVENARLRIAEIRGKLGDISYAYPGWGERLKSIDGLLTCGLVALHHVREEMTRAETKTVMQPAHPNRHPNCPTGGCGSGPPPGHLCGECGHVGVAP